jgi:hypothetical protein
VRSSLSVNAIRYGIPGAILLAGVIVSAVGGRIGVEAGALFISAGTAVLLLNVLYRLGVEGDRERDREEEARRFFDEHGHWPDEAPSERRNPPPRDPPV